MLNPIATSQPPITASFAAAQPAPGFEVSTVTNNTARLEVSSLVTQAAPLEHAIAEQLDRLENVAGFRRETRHQLRLDITRIVAQWVQGLPVASPYRLVITRPSAADASMSAFLYPVPTEGIGQASLREPPMADHRLADAPIDSGPHARYTLQHKLAQAGFAIEPNVLQRALDECCAGMDCLPADATFSVMTYPQTPFLDENGHDDEIFLAMRYRYLPAAGIFDTRYGGVGRGTSRAS